MTLDERFVPAGVHGLGDDAELDLPTAAELRRERLEREAPEILLTPRGRRGEDR